MSDRTYIYIDPDGDRLEIVDTDLADADRMGAMVRCHAGGEICSVLVPRSAAADVAAALCYIAAGRDVIILDRPADIDGDYETYKGVRVAQPAPDGVWFQLTYDRAQSSGSHYSPAEARKLAAHIAARADRAETDDVTKLEALLAAYDMPSRNLTAAARDVLAAIDRRERR